MWCVIRVNTGKEEEVIVFMKSIMDIDKLGKPFIPKVVRKKRALGEWKDRFMPFVPGYVFFETDDPDALFFALKKIPKRTSLLRIDEDILSVSKQEETFIRAFFGEDDVVGISRGHKEGDGVVIDAGPLVGKEGIISKVDPHKRKAVVATEMFGRKMELTLGVEILL